MRTMPVFEEVWPHNSGYGHKSNIDGRRIFQRARDIALEIIAERDAEIARLKMNSGRGLHRVNGAEDGEESPRPLPESVGDNRDVASGPCH